MREILFRGKTAIGEWVEGFYGQFHNRPTLNEPNKHQIFVLFTEEEEKQNKGHFLSAIGGIWHTCDPETVGQYTGLTDKNGTKIFEGDVVLFSWGDDKNRQPFYIEFVDGEFRATPKEITQDVWSIRIASYAPDFEVIGNIHDNPELLKGGAE